MLLGINHLLQTLLERFGVLSLLALQTHTFRRCNLRVLVRDIFDRHGSVADDIHGIRHLFRQLVSQLERRTQSLGVFIRERDDIGQLEDGRVNGLSLSLLLRRPCRWPCCGRAPPGLRGRGVFVVRTDNSSPTRHHGHSLGGMFGVATRSSFFFGTKVDDVSGQTGGQSDRTRGCAKILRHHLDGKGEQGQGEEIKMRES
jgi:hypothetical protein